MDQQLKQLKYEKILVHLLKINHLETADPDISFSCKTFNLRNHSNANNNAVIQ